MTNNPSPDLVRSVTEFRRDLHQYPELAFQEERTSQKVVEQLSDVDGLCIKTGVGGTGVVVTMEGEQPGPCIALRADMDALPIEEEGSHPWISKNSGLMHACGHDGHTACLVGAVKMLSLKRKQIHGSLKFLFQPAEEGGAGALKMCEDGALKNPDVKAIFGAHCWPREDWGTICLSKGAAMAAQDDFHITIKGKGGHAAAPHLSIDPISLGAQIVTAAQQLVSRMRNPLKPAVISVCQFQAGTATNVIPEQVYLAGTIRSYDPDLRLELRSRFEKLASGIAESFGATVDFRIHEGYPAVINDDIAFDLVEKVALETFGSDKVDSASEPSMGAEDFAFYLREVPGMFWKFGMRKSPTSPQLHTPQFDFCDDTIPMVVRMHTEVALAALEFYRDKE